MSKIFGNNNPYADDMLRFPYLDQMPDDWLKAHDFDMVWREYQNGGDNKTLIFLNELAKRKLG